MRIRIQQDFNADSGPAFTLMRIHADPDPPPYFQHKVLEDDVKVTFTRDGMILTLSLKRCQRVKEKEAIPVTL
jgi:hypothetical protein